MNDPLPIDSIRQKSRETPICYAIAHINAQIERASAHQKWEVEIDLKDKIKSPNAGKGEVTHLTLRGDEAAKLLPEDYKQALAIFRREGYGVQYFYDEHFDYDPYNGGWSYSYKVKLNWHEKV